MSLRFQAIDRVYLCRASQLLFSKPESNACHSAHAAVSSPIYLCHLASHDIRLETPAPNSCRRAFFHDNIMTRWQRDLEPTLAICRERFDGRIAGLDHELRITHRRNTRPFIFSDRSGSGRRNDNRAFYSARAWRRCFCHGCHGAERDKRRCDNRDVHVSHPSIWRAG
jgi:hypothetical protein